MNLSARPSRRVIAITAATATALALVACRRARHSPHPRRPRATTATTTPSPSSRSACRRPVCIEHLRSIPGDRGCERRQPRRGTARLRGERRLRRRDARGSRLERHDRRVPVHLRRTRRARADRARARARYETGAFTGTGYGEVDGQCRSPSISCSPTPRRSTSGCEAADFAGLDFSGTSDIALIQRGFCNFSVKALNAEAAGAEAVVIMNQGNAPDRIGAHRRDAGRHRGRPDPRRRGVVRRRRRARAGRLHRARVRAGSRAASAEERDRRAARARTQPTS